MMLKSAGAFTAFLLVMCSAPASARYIESDPIGLVGGLNTYTYVGANPVSRIDPWGLWQVTITGGLGLGVSITFGHNSGQWNGGGYVGLGEGISGTYNPNDSGTKECGGHYGVTGSGKIGLGENLEADGTLGFNGENSGGVTANDPFINHVAYGVGEENGQLQPIQPVTTFLESGFIGVGGVVYGNGGR